MIRPAVILNYLAGPGPEFDWNLMGNLLSGAVACLAFWKASQKETGEKFRQEITQSIKLAIMESEKRMMDETKNMMGEYAREDILELKFQAMLTALSNQGSRLDRLVDLVTDMIKSNSKMHEELVSVIHHVVQPDRSEP